MNAKRYLAGCLAALLGLGLLPACGQKGPLYLPESQDEKKNDKQTLYERPGASARHG